MSKQLINEYRAELDKLRQISGSRRESVVREPFKDLLKRWGKSQDLQFVAEHAIVTPKGNRIYTDGALLHGLRVPFGYREVIIYLTKQYSQGIDCVWKTLPPLASPMKMLHEPIWKVCNGLKVRSARIVVHCTLPACQRSVVALQGRILKARSVAALSSAMIAASNTASQSALFLKAARFRCTSGCWLITCFARQRRV